MRDVLGAGTILGYCTNVHAGVTREKMLENLERYALAVKQRVSADQPMGVGLWLAAPAARELLEQDRVGELRQWLTGHGLLACTWNGFPHGDFHQQVVKHRVYEPDWRQQARLDYTCDLIDIAAGLLPGGAEGSISTLPLGWRASFGGVDSLAAAAENLCHAAEHMARVEVETGRWIHLDIEPEPGCVLDTSAGVVSFFEEHLLLRYDEALVRRHLRVCYDICHAAVMFEDHQQAIERYAAAGISIGKVQIASAVRVDFDAWDAETRRSAADQLRGFAEDRYLHQTVIRDPNSTRTRLMEDLPAALAEAEAEGPSGEGLSGEWRVHFHVPLFVERFGLLGTTQDHIEPCLAEILAKGEVKHFEAETYAWDVLPHELRAGNLAEGIARELLWLQERFSKAAAI